MSFINRSSFPLAILVGLMAGFNLVPAFSASEPEATGCSALEAGLIMLSHQERSELDRFIGEMIMDDVLGSAVGKKSFIVNSARDLKKSGAPHNEKLLRFISSTKNDVDRENVNYKLKVIRPYLEERIHSYSANSSYLKILKCAMTTISEGGSSKYSGYLDEFIVDLSKKFNSSRVGYFSVKINSCSASSRVGTRNSFSEPKKWDDSRFLIIDATFKNQDTEGRLPVEGDLVINHEGNELRYDTTETILQEGYGIYFKSINPLVSMRTKIVYRIPDEISGEVYWVPGRNTDGVRLWCTFVSGVKK